MKVYGLLPGEYDQLYEAQDGLCGICGPKTGRRGVKRKLSVDHNHETDEVRGLLCMTCNDFLGLIQDDPDIFERGKQYLLDPPARKVLQR